MKPAVTPKTHDKTKRSKAYARYENLLAGIEQQRQFAVNVVDGLRKASVKIKEEFSPLEKDVHLLNRSYIIRLDELEMELGIGKYNREWFEGYMADELDTLLDFFGHNDEVLSKLYKKYAGVSVDEIADDDDLKATVKSLSEAFGFNVDIKEFLEKGQRAYFEEYRDKMGGRNETQTAGSEDEGANGTDRSKKNDKKLRREEADAGLARDARAIYLRLIKKFHPDLEKDDVVREEKNEIVKQVTKAYQENDFFSLLKLQVLHLEDNEADAEEIADDMIKRYNKILQKQLDTINQQIWETHLVSGAIIEDFIDKNGKFSAQKFTARKRAIEKTISLLSAILQDSKKRPKGWFKDQIASIKQQVQQNMMEDIFNDMFGSFSA